MPRYDYRCAAGHEQEVQASRDDREVPCVTCGAVAQRFIAAAHVPGAIGFTPKPTREHYVNVNRAVEASAEIAHIAEKTNTPVPDFWKIAKDRVRRGDVQAIV